MNVKDFLGRTTIANVVAGAVVLISAVYAFINRDTALLKYLAAFSAGWLFGTTAALRGNRSE